MSEGRTGAFLSYAQEDDRALGGLISSLRDEISTEVQQRTGSLFIVFQDRKSLRWGDEWDPTIQAAISASMFLIPIVTPYFVKSEACRRELLLFAEHAKQTGHPELILPLYLVDVDAINKEVPVLDEVVTILRTRQYIDLRPYRRQPLEALSSVIIDIGSSILDRLAQLEVEGRHSKPVSIDAPDLDQAAGGLKVVSPAPDYPSADFRDRRDIFPLLVKSIVRPDSRLTVMVAAPGGGKTAIVSELQSRMESRSVLSDFGAFVYLDARGFRPATVATVIEDLADCIQDPSRSDRLRRRLREANGSWYELVGLVLRELSSRHVLYVIDGAEALLTPSGTFRDRSFQNLLELMTTRRDHSVHLLFVSSIALNVRYEGFQPSNAIDLKSGLPFEDGEPLFRSWAKSDSRWKEDASEAEVEDLFDLTAGSPRLLELVLNASLAWAGAPPAEQIELIGGVQPSRLTGYLLDVALDAMSDTAVNAVLALAAFGRPVPERAISDLLGRDCRRELDGLASSRFIRKEMVPVGFLREDIELFYLPPEEASYLLVKAASGPMLEKRELLGMSGPLIRRAADWLSDEAAITRVDRVDDLAYHLREIELRLAAGDYKLAFRKTVAIDEEYLEGWGHSDVLSDTRLALEGKLRDADLELRNLAQYANAKSQQEQGDAALSAVNRGDAHLAGLEKGRRARAKNLQMLMRARIAYDDGRMAEADEMYRVALEQPSALSRVERTQALTGLALCRAEAGMFDNALEGLQDAEDFLGLETDRTASRLRAQLYYNEGRVHLYNGEYKRAQERVGLANSRARAVDDRLLTTQCTDAFALLYYCEGNDERAARFARRASDEAVRLGSPKLARSAFGTLALIELNRRNTSGALAAAEASRQFVGSHKGWGALAVLGVARLHSADLVASRGAFYEGLNFARMALQKDPHSFQALEFEGLILTGLSVVGPRSYVDEAVSAYLRARAISRHAGVIKLCMLKLHALLAEEPPVAYKAVIAAARGD